MPRTLTTTSHAVLGLLTIRPWTTYELAKQVQRSLGWFWPRAERKLYEEPKHLVAAGYATAKEERTGRRPRTVYAVTPAGRRAMRRWLGEAAAPPALEFEAMLKVFFADAGDLDQLRSNLEAVARDADQRLTTLRSMVATSPAEDDDEFAGRRHLNALGLRYLADAERQRARWARWALDQIAHWRSTSDPGNWDWRHEVARL